MEKPGTVHCIFMFTFIIWLISTTGQFLSVCIFHAKSKLFCFCRKNIKECYLVSQNHSFFSIFYFFQMYFLTNVFGFFCSQKHLGHLLQKADHFVMSVDYYFAIKLSSCHSLAIHTEHPDNSQQMVDMFMRNKNRTDILPADSGIFQLFQNGASTAAIYHKIFFTLV